MWPRNFQARAPSRAAPRDQMVVSRRLEMNVGGGRYGQLMIHVEVRGKVPGADGDGLPDVLVELEPGATTVRELIRLAVGEQVRRLCGDTARCRQALDRQYLSEEDVREQARTGAVRLPASPGRPD